MGLLWKETEGDVIYDLMPIMLHNSKWRHYRLKLKDNTFIKLKDKIKTSEELKVYLDTYMPSDCYQTISWWLNPQRLGSRIYNQAGFPILDNFFLGTDYVMDFDDKDYEGQDSGIKELKQSLKILKTLGMSKFIIMRTGRGYQLIVGDFNEWCNLKIDNPRDREYAYLYKMQKLTDLLRFKYHIKWDYEVSNDTRRICRVPNTYHNNGNIIKIKYDTYGLNTRSEAQADDNAR